MQIVQFLREYCLLLWFFTLGCFGGSSALLDELLDEVGEFGVVQALLLVDELLELVLFIFENALLSLHHS